MFVETVYAELVWENAKMMVLVWFASNVMIQKMFPGVVFAENVKLPNAEDYVFVVNVIVRNVMETAMVSSMKNISQLKMISRKRKRNFMSKYRKMYISRILY